jgi:hypothetical protein
VQGRIEGRAQRGNTLRRRPLRGEIGAFEYLLAYDDLGYLSVLLVLDVLPDFRGAQAGELRVGLQTDLGQKIEPMGGEGKDSNLRYGRPYNAPKCVALGRSATSPKIKEPRPEEGAEALCTQDQIGTAQMVEGHGY